MSRNRNSIFSISVIIPYSETLFSILGFGNHVSEYKNILISPNEAEFFEGSFFWGDQFDIPTFLF